ncbi:MAG TPA: NUDIX hydrolase [Ktedonobacterales bacterium]
MKPGKIRALALALILHEGAVLAQEGYDPSKHGSFLRLPGGGIEFGETGAAAVAREMREEITAELADVRYVATLENIFTFDGKPGHEICLIYAARLLDPALTWRERIIGHDTSGAEIPMRWAPLAALDTLPIYPDGVLDLIRLMLARAAD